MRTRVLLFTALLFGASHARAQSPAPPTPPAAPAPAAVKAPPAPAPAAVPAPPAPPARQAQPINIRVELTISEIGGGAPLKKTVTAVVGDGYSSYVRETGVEQIEPAAGQFRDPGSNRTVTPLNLDARPEILANGRIRLTCTIQYQSSPQRRDDNTRRVNTDIKQNLVLNLENGRTLTISEATDPITDRKVTVEVTATILK